MELDAVQGAPAMDHGLDEAGAALGRHAEATLQRGVAHDDLLVAFVHGEDGGKAGEEPASLAGADLLGAQVLRHVAAHRRAEGARQRLVAEADAEQRPAPAGEEFQQGRSRLVVADHLLRTRHDRGGGVAAG